MSNNLFQFKQFSIHQNKTAMKVGTDGVLLGAWTLINDEASSILDIGSGTGLIALMMAQKSDAEVIDAVEIEEKAYEQTVENFENSDWGNRLFCYHSSFQDFANEIDEKYDLIVSNPPFYNSTYKKLDKERALARHSESLSYYDLIKGVSKLLSVNGVFSIIIPFNEEEFLLKKCKEFLLFPNRITRVKGNIHSKIKRSLIEFSFAKKPIDSNELIIEINRHNYTSEYINLVKYFYLKM